MIPMLVVAALLKAAAGIAMDEANATAPAPKVALVLSGGGARGGAHIGVLRALEDAAIPIDLIVGTSIGALLGGLYAAGYSPEELEELVTSLRWDRLFEDAPDRRLFNFNNKERGDRPLFEVGLEHLGVRLPTGLQEGQQIQQLLDRLTASIAYEADYDFDRLPIRFRAVATDLETGERRVFAAGPLSRAIRASIAIPALFTPAEVDGRLYVDGGIADNLPVSVARELGAELVIAVDASTPLRSSREIVSLVEVLDQAISFRIQERTEHSRHAADVLIAPELGDFDAGDFGHTDQVIALGVEAGRAKIDVIRHALPQAAARPIARGPGRSLSAALDPDPAGDCEQPSISVDQIRFEGLSAFPRRYATSRLELPRREPICWSAIDRQASILYGTDLFRQVSYRLHETGGGRHLIYQVREVPPTRLGLGARYDTDYKFTLLLDLIDRNFLDSRSDLFLSWMIGNLKDFQLGVRHAALGSAPLSLTSRFRYHSQQRQIFVDGERSGDFQDRRYGFNAGAEYLLGNFGRVELGYRFDRVNIDRGGGVFNQESHKTVAGLSAALRFDNVDDFDFPRGGQRGELEYRWSEPNLGSSFSYHRASASLQRYITLGSSHTFELGGSYGRTSGQRAPFYEHFHTGGANYL
ncbi:MAG TPA: patatin-like phospholipase family protein, partial [Acidobacteriota bacterium]